MGSLIFRTEHAILSFILHVISNFMVKVTVCQVIFVQFLMKEELLFKVDQTFLKINETPKIITSILSGQTIMHVVSNT